MSNRLTNSQIVIVRSLFKRSGGRPVSLDANWQREFVPALSKRGIIEIWYSRSSATTVRSVAPS